MTPTKRTKLPIFLLLLPIFSLLHAYNDLPGFIPFKPAVTFLLLTYLTLTLIYLICWQFTKHTAKSATITFIILLLLLFFGAWHDLIKKIITNNLLSSYKVIIPVTLVLTFLLIKYIIKKDKTLYTFNQYLSTLMLILFILELSKAFINTISVSKTKNLIYTDTSITQQYRSCNQADSSKPDIYFLVFDEYTNNQTLQEVWNFRNDSITNWLTEQGFYIVTNGKANYDLTPFSISTTFNMNYIDNRKIGKKDSVFYILQAVRSLSDNTTFSLLKKENYNIRFFAPFDNPIENIGLLQEFVDYPPKKLYNHTLPGRIQRDILWNFIPATSPLSKPRQDQFSYTNWPKRVKDVQLTIDKIKSTTNTLTTRQPQFVYGHFMVTHDPHLFNANGTARTARDMVLNSKLFTTYTQQIQYANKILHDLVTHIQQHNRKNTIIIIEGDHGFRHMPDTLKKHDFSNLNSIYFPDRDYRQFYQEMSPVNTFRVLFNHYFCQSLARLKDSSIKVNY
ncbi:hypothetical protein D3H65_17710 [Paraflavitalea soli]|uniref:Sulfatase N-terminal domain-containing protein n=1 Tax=Paraflavitalea soli TaxID=2315862 RepID=A0A3B7MQT0_9BACT|nr:sulfatase-like hydrolase/transferase [Paraflavitalea soli]AXY75703.1 hypothetical protein D3H65_17710 [Paraflavitalea soli]